VIEDVLAVVSVALSLFVPPLIFIIVAAGLVVSFLLLPRIARFFRQVLQSVRGVFSTATL
jgi:hypothetical protein